MKTLFQYLLEVLTTCQVCSPTQIHHQSVTEFKGHFFTHEPRAATITLWEPKRKCPKAIPTHFQNHAVWPRTLKYNVMSYATGPSTKCYSINFYSRESPHMIKLNKPMVVSVWSAMVSWVCVRPTSKRWFLKLVQVTIRHDPFDTM